MEGKDSHPDTSMEPQAYRKGILKPQMSMKSYIGKSVVNLSDKKLTKHEMSVLAKGLTFCPTPDTPSMYQIWKDLDAFNRRLRLKVFFKEEDNDPLGGNATQEAISPRKEITRKLKIKSTWDPTVSRCSALESFTKAVKHDFLLSKIPKQNYHNLSVGERKALRGLPKHTNLVIKKVDKGSAVCVMNIEDYIWEANRQLANPMHYKKADYDLTRTHADQIQYIVDQVYNKDLIDQKTYNYLSPDSTRAGRFYLLPKIHKDGVPGRPICSSIGHPTEGISKFCDIHINKFVQTTDSFIKDTIDFITKILDVDPLPEGCIIASLDVVSLYSNIPNQEGINAVFHLLRRKDRLNPMNHWVLKLLEAVLTKNNFEFNGSHYLQIGGTAMGTKVAPAYANIFMDHLERKLVHAYHLQPLLWVRFIDDIFTIWTHGLEEFNSFFEYLNNAHHSIKFTKEVSDTEIVFLDTRVCVDEQSRKLFTRLHTKPTDTHDYLYHTSSHPTPCTEGGPKGQFLRIRRICTRDSDYELEGKSMIQHYIKRGYKATKLVKTYLEVGKLSQALLIKPKTSKKETLDRIPLIMTFNPRNPNIREIVKKHWPSLQSASIAKEAFQKAPLIGFKRSPNLKNLLTKASLPDPNSDHKAKPVYKQDICRRYRCKYCEIVKGQKTFTSTVTGEKITTVPEITCMTRNVIYIIDCTLCKKLYVGETKRPIRKRTYEHFRDISKRDVEMKPIARHFCKPRHSSKHVRMGVIEVIKGDPTLDSVQKYRKDRELEYIYQLRSLEPFVINNKG